MDFNKIVTRVCHIRRIVYDVYARAYDNFILHAIWWSKPAIIALNRMNEKQRQRFSSIFPGKHTLWATSIIIIIEHVQAKSRIR